MVGQKEKEKKQPENVTLVAGKCGENLEKRELEKEILYF